MTARHFRLVLSNFAGRSGRKAADASLAEIVVSAAPRLERYVEKQLEKCIRRRSPYGRSISGPCREKRTIHPCMWILRGCSTFHRI